MGNPWATAAVRTGSLHRTFPDALASLIRRSRTQACLEGMPDTTRLRVTITRTPAGSVWLDGEPLPPIPGVNVWGPPPAGAPCTCLGYPWEPKDSCPQHGLCPDPCQCMCHEVSLGGFRGQQTHPGQRCACSGGPGYTG